jgi:hypothetical protein
MVVNRIKKVFGDLAYGFRYLSYSNYKDVKRWEKEGKPVPPPGIIKRDIIKQFRDTFGYGIFIETGTYLGDTTSALKYLFDRIYTIELSHELYNRARAMFEKYGHISVIEGSSSEQLPLIMEKIDAPCIFWLDGHYSGEGTARGCEDTPILAELECICAHRIKDHVILIDDARLFTGSDGYPTMDSVKELVASHSSYSRFEVSCDIIRIYNHRN